MRIRTEPAAAGADALLAGLREDLAQVEAFIEEALRGDGPLVGEAAVHLMGGGKRLRPALVLLSGLALGAEPAALIPVAAAVEITHMATLVHDDMIDGSRLRRGVPTVHAKWGDATGVLMGDYLFARGFSVLAATGLSRVVRIMSDVVSRMCAGEMRELAEQWVAPDESGYFDRIDAKTAYFIGEACRLGGVVAGAGERQEEALAAYGSALGLSYQVTDDILDLIGSAASLGKPGGADLRAGVVTLPFIHALRHASDADELSALLDSRRVGDHEIERVREVVTRSGSLAYARSRAAELARAAQRHLGALPPGRARDTLAVLAEQLVDRSA